jgi:aromatic-L-amino-acid decarboxylase
VTRRPVPPSTRAGEVQFDPTLFRRLGHELVDRIADHNHSLSSAPVTSAADQQAVREALDGIVSDRVSGTAPEALLSGITDVLLEHSLFNGHPRFWGYITSSPAPLGVLGDLLASAVNANVGAWILAPVATEIERDVVRWIADFIEFPAGGGLLVSGGNAANHVAFIAAMRAAYGPEIRTSGLRGLEADLVLYASRETHTWVQKSADASGIGTDSIRWIETDADGRVRTGAMAEAIRADLAEGRRPFLAIGSAGTVSTGVVDPLDELADLCQEFGLWFHVDGAYGGLAATVPEVAGEFEGLARADSVAVDPHKWLYSPLEAGCTLVRNPAHLTSAFSYHPPYYNFESAELNYVDYGPQNSRGFRALKVWLSCQHLGMDGHRKLISEDIALARYAYDVFDRESDLEALTCYLSITTFRYVPERLVGRLGQEGAEEELDAMNHELLEQIERSGEYFVSQAVVNGQFALRMCIVNFRTTVKDIDGFPEFVRRLAGEDRPHR